MLEVANKYQEQLIEKFRNTWFKEKYKFWNGSVCYEEWKPEENTWDSHQFVSIGSNGEVIGYIGYRINRSSDSVYGLNIINFTDNKITFGVDVGRALLDIFERFHFRKLSFVVIIGNPIEHTYDRLIEKHGGRIVGYQRKHVRLIDGQFYDEKLYEILEEEYSR